MPSQASILFQTGYTSILKGFVDGQIYKNIFFSGASCAGTLFHENQIPAPFYKEKIGASHCS